MNTSSPRIKIGELIANGEAAIQTGPFGTQLKASDYVETGAPVINVRNIGYGSIRAADLEFLDERMATKLAAHQLKNGDIVFGRKGAVDRHALISRHEDGWIQGSDCLRLRLTSDKICERFTSFYFQTAAHKSWMEALCSFGATMASLNQDIVKRISLPLFPLQTQHKISAILTAYDDLIATNKRRITLLEKMAEEIYREWFVRRRFPGHLNAKIIKGVPDGWERMRFGEFCMLKRGYDLPNDLVEEGPYPVVGSTSVKTFHKHYKVEPPVITTGRSGSLGVVLMTQARAWPLNTALYVREFFGNSPFLVFYTLKNMGLEKFNSGAGIPTLNRNHLNSIPMVVPDKDLQQRFDGIVEPIHKQGENCRDLNVNLTKTRDILLPRLISGKLSVADLDIQFPPSMLEGDKGAERTALDSTSESGQVHRL